MADASVMAAVLTWVENHASVDGEPVVLEDVLDDGVDGFIVSAIPGDPWVKQYKGGGGVAAQAFAVVARRNNPDTQRRLDTISALGDIAASIRDRNTWPALPDGFAIYNLEERTSPGRIGHDDSGADDYQVTFTLTYRK
jgi:hypothetical protein